MQDESGFTAWARQHQQRLLRVAYLTCGDAGRAEDLVQEALTKVALRWPHLGENPLAYARTIIYRDHISWWRRLKGRERPHAIVPEASRPDAAPEDRLVVMQALARLSLRQRQVLVMRFFDDLTEAECASQLGISIGTVKSTTSDALKALRTRSPELATILTEV